MKINIGPYTNYFGPYQLARLLCFWVDRVEDKYGVEIYPNWVEDFGEWLSNTWVGFALEWLEAHKERKIKIKIDKYDTWSMDHTLALIIVPMLKQLKETQHGCCYVNDKDLPRNIRSQFPVTEEEDSFLEERWNWVMDEMIWSFEQIINKEDNEAQFYSKDEFKAGSSFEDYLRNLKVDRKGLKAHQDRIHNGLVLFGKYYQHLWD